jgi:hypothetical protein
MLCAIGAFYVFQVLMRASIEDNWVSFPTASSQPRQASPATSEPRRDGATEFRDSVSPWQASRRPWFRVGFMRNSQILDSRQKCKTAGDKRARKPAGGGSQ